jgi:hypothetical protein
VEIYFWHQIDQLTLGRYLEMGERVLEIDISGERKKLFDYQYLKAYFIERSKGDFSQRALEIQK